MRVWMDEREGSHIVIKLQSQNFKTTATKETFCSCLFCLVSLHYNTAGGRKQTEKTYRISYDT